VFLDGPHLLLLIYINTKGMMNLKVIDYNCPNKVIFLSVKIPDDD
jgi:hypothetical protein